MAAFGTIRATTPRATQRASVRDLCWAAGFLEGEGHFGRGGPDKVRWHGTERITAPQVNLEPLLRLQALFGGSIRLNKTTHGRFSTKPIYVWSVSGTLARGVMMTLYSLLTDTRKQQVCAALHGR